MFTLTPVVRGLLLLNVAVLLLQLNTALIPSETFALHAFVSPLFRPWQLLTYNFMHGGWGHLIGNSLSLLFFGAMLEERWGSLRFLTFYLVCGVGAGLLYNAVRAWELHQMLAVAEAFLREPTALNLDRFADLFDSSAAFYPLVLRLKQVPGDATLIAQASQVVEAGVSVLRDVPTLGASGAVFGILFAFGYLFPNTEILLYFAFPIKAKYFVFLYGAYELYSGLNRSAGDNVAHFAHLGGMLIAFLLLKYWEKRHPDFY